MASGTGIVKRLMREKGFGFIQGNDGEEWFFHQSSCQDFESSARGSGSDLRQRSGSKRGRAEKTFGSLLRGQRPSSDTPLHDFEVVQRGSLVPLMSRYVHARHFSRGRMAFRFT